MTAEHRGDAGQTDLLGHRRVSKDDPVVEALGALDEATSALGVAKCAAREVRTRRAIHQVQHDLYQLMADVASPADPARAGTAGTPPTPGATRTRRTPRITADHVAWLDRGVAALQAEVDVPPKFILPGGCAASAAVDVARAVVRTAERRLAHVAADGALPGEHALPYANRLSLLLYYLARLEDLAAGVDFDLAAAPEQRSEI